MPRQRISGRRGCLPSLFYSSKTSDFYQATQQWQAAFAFVDVICNPSPHHHLPKSSCPQCRSKNKNRIPTPQLFSIDKLVDIDYIASNNIENIFQHVQPSILPSHTSSSTSSFFISTSSTLISRVIPAILASISYVITSITSSILPVAYQLQRIGETLLTAFLLLSLVQALVALYQYRYDERGQLVFPDGPTMGREDYYTTDNSTEGEADIISKQNVSSKQDDQENVAVEHAIDTSFATDKSNVSWASKMIKKLNKSLVFLLPYITRNIHNLLTRNTHLFHIGFMVFILDSLLPLFDGDDDTMFAAEKRADKDANVIKTDSVRVRTSLLKKINSRKKIDNKDPLNVLVIGDSLAIGIGCIEKFDATKDNSRPFALIENTVAPQLTNTKIKIQGPVFPQVLARTLSCHLRRPVNWRSAGVDGGSIIEIDDHCMNVVKEESTQGLDIIVVLFGMNDLKKLLSVNPIKQIFSGGKGEKHDHRATSQFRHGMEVLLRDIHAHAPEALVVFPALPIQPFNKNSLINIFPLGMMVDAVLGVWERQKKIVASKSSNAVYVELKANEIADWYSFGNGGVFSTMDGMSDKEDSSKLIHNDLLISADGVHPNKKMYGKWAELVGKKIYNHVDSSKLGVLVFPQTFN